MAGIDFTTIPEETKLRMAEALTASGRHTAPGLRPSGGLDRPGLQ